MPCLHFSDHTQTRAANWLTAQELCGLIPETAQTVDSFSNTMLLVGLTQSSMATAQPLAQRRDLEDPTQLSGQGSSCAKNYSVNSSSSTHKKPFMATGPNHSSGIIPYTF